MIAYSQIDIGKCSKVLLFYPTVRSGDILLFVLIEIMNMTIGIFCSHIEIYFFGKRITQFQLTSQHAAFVSCYTVHIT